MQKYIKTYCDYFDYKTPEDVICEACLNPANDIHHIYGRSRETINDLIALCRKHHNMAHGDKNYVSKEEFQYIHNNFLAGVRKQFLK